MKIRQDRKPPIWKQKYEAFLRHSANARINRIAQQMVERLRISLAVTSVGLMSWFFYLFGFFAVIKSYPGTWFGSALIVVFAMLTGLLYKVLMKAFAVLPFPGFRSIQDKCFNPADYSKKINTDERIPIANFPDPRAGEFALATTGKTWIWRSFFGERFAGHILVVSKPQRYGRDNLASVLLHYLLADPSNPNVLAMILDSQGGVQFSPWLRYDYSEIKKNKDVLLALRDNVRKAELRDFERMQRIAVFDKDPDILGAIKWLDREVQARLDDAIDVFGSRRAPILVLLDEEVSEAFLQGSGKFSEVGQNLSNIVFNGKPTRINLVLFAPPELQLRSLKPDIKDWFDTIEFPHLENISRTDEGISKNAMPSFVDLIRVWLPQPTYGKQPYVDPEWSAEQIDRIGDLANDDTLGLWDAMLKIRPWEPRKLPPRDERKQPIINNLPEPRNKFEIIRTI